MRVGGQAQAVPQPPPLPEGLPVTVLHVPASLLRGTLLLALTNSSACERPVPTQLWGHGMLNKVLNCVPPVCMLWGGGANAKARGLQAGQVGSRGWDQRQGRGRD